MKAIIKQRLEQLESQSMDWISSLAVIDTDGILADYSKPEWQEIHHDDFVTVVRHSESGEIRGHYWDRRSDEQIQAEGGNLEYL